MMPEANLRMRIRPHKSSTFAAGCVLLAVLLATPVFAGAVTREAVLKRGEVWVAKNVPYSQSRYASEAGSLIPTKTASGALTSYQQSRLGWRTDCSGFVSMCYGLVRSDKTPLSLDTATLGSRMTKISASQLKPGDMILRPKNLLINGKQVPYGHAVLFVRWTDSTKTSYVGYHESSSNKGTIAATIRYPFGSEPGFSAYRYNGIEDVRLRKSRRWYYGSAVKSLAPALAEPATTLIELP